MLSSTTIIKYLTLLGLVAGLIGAVRLAYAVKPGRRSLPPPEVDKDRRSNIEALLDGDIYRSGVRLIFLGFLAQFSAVFLQLFYY
ncbi:MAG: hypothetical protein NG737_03035 [Omnitrophica bacterium]|nr:hypothetical protein [Candidatus Omnitrophota bacterium]